MEIEPIIEGKVYTLFDVDNRYREFYEELDDDRADAVDSFLDQVADGEIQYKPKCFTPSDEKICELKPKGVKNQIRIFVYKRGREIYILGAFIKKTGAGSRERDFYRVIAKRQKRLEEVLDG